MPAFKCAFKTTQFTVARKQKSEFLKAKGEGQFVDTCAQNMPCVK
ncbi:hypothetical protein PULV_a3078 [Pseudoalteromonas ulvae UL12]|nr:hypothetical protein [Pseudoalteromonas ulvae UL12]